MTNTTTTHMTEMEQMEKAISKFNAAYRKAGEWSRSGFGEKIKFSKSKEKEGHKDVLIGSKGWGCTLTYTITSDTLWVTSFRPVSGGTGYNTFDKSEAERGFNYLLSLAAALNLNSLVIEIAYMDTDNYDVFHKNGFISDYVEETYTSFFTMNLQHKFFYQLRKKFKEIQGTLKAIAKQNQTIKTEFISFNINEHRLIYTFSYYAYGVKGEFTVESDNVDMNLYEKELGIIILLDELSPTEADIQEFFETIKEQGKMISLLSPSDVIFNEVVPKKLLLTKDIHKEIFKHLSNEYKQIELDKRLKEKDGIIVFKEFQMSSYEVAYVQILDIFFIYKKDTNELTYYSKEDKAKAKLDFVNLTTKLYTKQTTEYLNQL